MDIKKAQENYLKRLKSKVRKNKVHLILGKASDKSIADYTQYVLEIKNGINKRFNRDGRQRMCRNYV